MYAGEHGNRAVGCEFTITEEKVLPWRYGHASIFSCMSITKNYTGPKKGLYPDVGAAALHFIKEHVHVTGYVKKGNGNFQITPNNKF
jgi:hypothetical protein